MDNRATEARTLEQSMTDARTAYMAQRFLGWKLPDDFNPDGGVSFDRQWNGAPRPAHVWPVGTNLFTATQAEAMVAYMLEGAGSSRTDEELTMLLIEAAKAEPILQFFGFAHLAPPLRAVSRPFAEQALRMYDNLPRNPERTVGFRKLIEAKDCAVRALIYKAGA